MANTTVKHGDEVGAVQIKGISHPVQLTSGFLELLPAGVVDGADNSGDEIQAPDSLDNRNIIDVQSRGSLACLRLQYDDGDTPSTNPVINLFGRKRGSGAAGWMLLLTRDGSDNITLVTAVTETDTTDGTNFFTTIDIDKCFDLMGCDEIIAGVETAYAASGDATLAVVQVKII